MKNLPSTALGFTLGVIIGLIVIPPLTASPDVNRTVLAQSTTYAMQKALEEEE